MFLARLGNNFDHASKSLFDIQFQQTQGLLGFLDDVWFQTQVIVVIRDAIGFISAAIVAVIGLFGSTLTIMLNKRGERKVELRKIKENQYIEFLGCVAEAKIANTQREATNKDEGLQSRLI